MCWGVQGCRAQGSLWVFEVVGLRTQGVEFRF